MFFFFYHIHAFYLTLQVNCSLGFEMFGSSLCRQEFKCMFEISMHVGKDRKERLR